MHQNNFKCKKILFKYLIIACKQPYQIMELHYIMLLSILLLGKILLLILFIKYQDILLIHIYGSENKHIIILKSVYNNIHPLKYF